MNDIFRRLQELKQVSLENLINLIDILLVAYVVYKILSLIRSTRAWRILGGIVIFVAALFLSDYLQLKTLHWLLDKATLLAPVAVVILLLPELRQTLEGFARLGLWPERLGGEARAGANTVEEIVAAVAELAANNIGALIVIERGTKLEDICLNGVQLNATVSAPLLGSIFYEGNPLHDGAAIIRDDRVIAAACRLPLSDNSRLDQHLHMRHRAGLGISEQSDAVVVIVSEERGTISVSIDGTLTKLPGHAELRDLLNTEVRGVHEDRPKLGRRRKEKVGA